jgi:hypothetical protein
MKTRPPRACHIDSAGLPGIARECGVHAEGSRVPGAETKGTRLMQRMIKLAAAMCAIAMAPLCARAQVASLPPAPAGGTPGWSFNVTPYIWLPTLNADLTAQGPRGGTVDTSVSADIGQILDHINFGIMGGAEARYDRFSVMTDLLYLNVSLTTSNTHLSSFNPGPGPIDIPRSLQLNTGTRLGTTIWSLAGAYTLLEGDWGNIDAIGGLRLAAVNSTTDYGLRFAILLPNRTIGLSRTGNLDVDKTYVDGIGGVTGRINIPNSKFYLPFYLDAGGGEIPFTWQGYAGVAYKIAKWGDVSAGYRYLRFENDSSTGLRSLSLGGAILALNCFF